ncbi:ClpP/crotonase [Myriangium duriaei CBS 260.36]|uniref:ClpP/crotonase n=1 Tax=Myriangium duriaei CBS 260.36 TaxID=1168546 RepID=A0A9P4IZH6_9PEZI|nr:ClpP/crotonase [Myriangium duriaei CBS 260.36]
MSERPVPRVDSVILGPHFGREDEEPERTAPSKKSQDKPVTGQFSLPSTALPILSTPSVPSPPPANNAATQPTTFQTLLVEDMPAPTIGTIKLISLSRPAAKNAISRLLLSELSTIITTLHSSSPTSTRCLILSSSVPGIFCAGADLKERASMTTAETHSFLHDLQSTFSALATLPIPSIAVVSGIALGGGLELALSCTLRVFSSSAVVGLPETRLGIIPGAGGTYRLQQLIGLSKAQDMILTGRRVGAHEAFAMGLCNRFVPAEGKEDQAVEAAVEVAREITRAAPLAIRAAIRAMREGTESAERREYESVLGTSDRDEALRAFVEKRAPVYTGS